MCKLSVAVGSTQPELNLRTAPATCTSLLVVLIISNARAKQYELEGVRVLPFTNRSPQNSCRCECVYTCTSRTLQQISALQLHDRISTKRVSELHLLNITCTHHWHPPTHPTQTQPHLLLTIDCVLTPCVCTCFIACCVFAGGCCRTIETWHAQEHGVTHSYIQLARRGTHPASAPSTSPTRCLNLVASSSQPAQRTPTLLNSATVFTVRGLPTTPPLLCWDKMRSQAKKVRG